MPFVVDNSVVCGWFIENQTSPYSEVIAQRLQDDRAHAPGVWELELTNVLRTACLKRRMNAERAQGVLVQHSCVASGKRFASRWRVRVPTRPARERGRLAAFAQ